MDPQDFFSGVFNLDTICLGFFLADVFQLLTCAKEIGNAFLYAKTKEKMYVIAGPGFGHQLEGKPMIIDKGLYGLRSIALRFHEYLASTLRSLCFSPTKADGDFLTKAVGDHYEYIAVYVDDVLIFSQDPMKYIMLLKDTYILKGVGALEYYLGGCHYPGGPVNQSRGEHCFFKQDIHQQCHTQIWDNVGGYHSSLQDSHGWSISSWGWWINHIGTQVSNNVQGYIR